MIRILMMRQIWYLQHCYIGLLVTQIPECSEQFWAKYSPMFLIKIITKICYRHYHCCHQHHYHTHHHCLLFGTIFLLYRVLLYSEEMPSKNMPVQRLKVATLPLDLPCCGLIIHSEEILTPGKSYNKKPDGLFPKDEVANVYFVC